MNAGGCLCVCVALCNILQTFRFVCVVCTVCFVCQHLLMLMWFAFAIFFLPLHSKRWTLHSWFWSCIKIAISLHQRVCVSVCVLIYLHVLLVHASLLQMAWRLRTEGHVDSWPGGRTCIHPHVRVYVCACVKWMRGAGGCLCELINGKWDVISVYLHERIM